MKAVRAALLASVLASLALVIAVAREPLPAALARAPAVSVEIADRSGRLLREVRTESGALSTTVQLSELSANVVPALLAAEDARFYSHPGVDPLAVVRAAAQALAERRIVSGASTLTQQLARNVVSRPRTLAGKVHEMVVALRIERDLDKGRILEEYLSRVEFGPNVRGIEAASQWYFDKPARALDLAEAAALVAIPRGPSLYDPRRFPARVQRRRDRILERMRERGLAEVASIDRALATRLTLQVHPSRAGVEHLALALGREVARGGGAGQDLRRIETTVDADLQAEVTALAQRSASDLEARGVTALAVLVVDNATAEVLAYVGSPDYFAVGALGANDGVRALRQPGSTLKPFVYAAAMDSLGMTAASLLPDVELVVPTERGAYRPLDYDGRFRGPVRLREALGSSLNVPAVHTAAAVGPARVLDLLRRAGFASLTESAEHYGAALALGDGEVRLSELAEAYSLLARDGERLPLRAVRAVVTADGQRREPAVPARVRVIAPATARILTDVLADDAARTLAFGRDGELSLPFPVAAKTGTSKGYRDNWTVGFTREITVAVWAGNFDGAPMRGSSGITGAAPLFHDVMLAAMQGRTAAPLVRTEGLVSAEVCSLSGARPGPTCTHRHREWFRPGESPLATCTMHVLRHVDVANGLLSRRGCPGAVQRPFEEYPPEYRAWAKAARRPTTPDVASPRCPDAVPDAVGVAGARVRFPEDGARFVLDDAALGAQEIVLTAAPADLDRLVTFVVDGRAVGAARAPYELPWRLVPGTHALEVQGSSGGASRPITFEVASAP